MKKILLVFGTRPEAIKMCPLIRELKSRASLEVKVCVTGQHRHMLREVLRVFEIVPDYDLSVMENGQSLIHITASVLQGLGEILDEVRPDMVLVHGDTSTAFSAALACFYRQIDLAHVEAGLRTHNIYSPYPEEFNRRTIALIAKYNFAPTPLARENLLREGVREDSIYVTGNTVMDAIRVTLRSDYTHGLLEWANGSRLVLMTAHRRESLGEPLCRMLRGVRRVVEERFDVKVIFPAHKNPAVREIAERELSGCDRIRVVEPLSVFDFHNILFRSYMILTDSGGVQEEAVYLGVPALVMREVTERHEGVELGALRLVGTSEDSIYQEFSRLLDRRELYRRMCRACDVFGDGSASARISDVIEEKA